MSMLRDAMDETATDLRTLAEEIGEMLQGTTTKEVDIKGMVQRIHAVGHHLSTTLRRTLKQAEQDRPCYKP